MDNGNGHVIVCGYTDSGKGQGHELPTTAMWLGSMLIVDAKATDDCPRGENHDTCGALRRLLGPVYRFAPTQPGSCYINILNTVAWGKPQQFADVTLITRSMCMPAQNDRTRSDEAIFWGGQSTNMLRAATLFVGNFLPDPSFPKVLRVMQDRMACLQAMAACQHPLITPAAQEMLRIQKQAEKQFTGAWTAALQALDIYQDPLVAQFTSKSDFALTDVQFADTPVTLYLSARSTSELVHLSSIFRPIIEQTFAQLKAKRAKKRQRLLALFNEFPAMRYMPTIEQDFADVRTHQIRLLLSLQTPGQLFGLYGEQTPIWGNTVTKVFHRLADDKFAQRLSKNVLGDRTEEYVSVSSSTNGGQRSQSQSQHRTSRPLLDTSELLSLDNDAVLVWSSACTPHVFQAKKVRYWRDAMFAPYRQIV